MKRLLIRALASSFAVAALALPATAQATEYPLPAGMVEALQKPPSYPTGGVGKWFAGAYSEYPGTAWVQMTAISTSLENEAERVCWRYTMFCNMAGGYSYSWGLLQYALKEVGGTINVPADHDEIWVNETPLGRSTKEHAEQINVSAAKLASLTAAMAASMPLIVVHVEKVAAALIRHGHK